MNVISYSNIYIVKFSTIYSIQPLLDKTLNIFYWKEKLWFVSLSYLNNEILLLLMFLSWYSSILTSANRSIYWQDIIEFFEWPIIWVIVLVDLNMQRKKVLLLLIQHMPECLFLFWNYLTSVYSFIGASFTRTVQI